MQGREKIWDHTKQNIVCLFWCSCDHIWRSRFCSVSTNHHHPHPHHRHHVIFVQRHTVKINTVSPPCGGEAPLRTSTRSGGLLCPTWQPGGESAARGRSVMTSPWPWSPFLLKTTRYTSMSRRAVSRLAFQTQDVSSGLCAALSRSVCSWRPEVHFVEIRLGICQPAALTSWMPLTADVSEFKHHCRIKSAAFGTLFCSSLLFVP